MSEGEGASNKNFGPGGNRWHGQIVDDSVWRDNILAGKYEDKDTPPGWGRRYKVRVFGEHDLGGEKGFPIPDEELPWANIEFPVTAGSGAGNCKQTPLLRQGNIVSGYWADGHNKQMPIITGVLANNEQNEMGTEYPVPVTESGTSLAVSAFPNKQLKLPELVARPKPPQISLITKKPKPADIAREAASVVPGAKVDDLGLPLGRARTPAILADLKRAAEVASAREDAGQELNPEQILELKRFYVHRGINERNKRASSPFSGASPGATTEALGEHLKTAQDIGRENKCQEKIILISPDNVVDSATKAIQTITDNLTKQIKLYTNSLTDYAAATQRPSDDFGKMVKDSATQISKYMKVILQKQQEYTNKKMNAELTDVVAEMPSYMRAQFLDVKEENNKELLKQFNSITDDMGGLLEDILSKSLDIKSLVDGIKAKASNSGSSSSSGAGISNGTPNENSSSSFASADNTTDYSGTPQPYSPTQTYIVGDTIRYEGRNYINKLTSTDISPPNNIHWAPVSGESWGDTEGQTDYENEEQSTYTKVPVCYAEDIIGQVFSYNKESINGAVGKAVKGMNRYVEDMQSQLDSYDATFKYKATMAEDKAVISISDEEGLGDDRGGGGYTTQTGCGTTFRGNLGNTEAQATGEGLTVDIRVSRGGPAGRAPEFKDADFTKAGMVGIEATIDEEYYWVTLKDEGSGYQYKYTVAGTPPTTVTEDTGTLLNCSTSIVGTIDPNGTQSNGQGATVDVYFVNNKVKAVRCKVPYSLTLGVFNTYKLGDILQIDGSTATGTNDGVSGFDFAGSGAQFAINFKPYQNVNGRLRGPIDDNGIQLSNGGANYLVGQLLNVSQIGNPFPDTGLAADNIGAPSGGNAGEQQGYTGVDASFSIVGVLDKGNKRAGVADDPAAVGGGSGGFSNMLSSLSGVMGNLTSALDFDNMPVNIFPGEKSPNKALADFYTLGDAGQAAPDGEIPMMGAIAEAAAQKVPDLTVPESIPFALPFDPPDVNILQGITSQDIQTGIDNTVAGWRQDAENFYNQNNPIDT